MFFRMNVSHLQAEMEKIIEHFGAMPVFSNEQFALMRLWSVHEGEIDIVKDGNHVRIVCHRTPHAHVSQLPVIDFSIGRDGKWNFISMKNSRFLDEYDYVNSRDYWECVLRLENFTKGRIDAVRA